MMIEVKSLYHDYTGKGQFSVTDVSFMVGKGEIFGFLGPSGAGKSTVQNVMTGLLQLQRGEIAYDGVSIGKAGADFFNRIGVSFEHPNLYTRLSGYENLYYFARLFDVPTEDPLKMLDAVGLRGDAHKKAGQYSKGMRQRLVFTRSLINNPEILFLDEPTSGLDPNTAMGIKEMIKERQKRGCTILLTTHNMFLADELCDRVAFLDEGKVVAMDAPRSLKLQYGESSVKVEYMDGAVEKSELFFIEQETDRERFSEIITNRKVQTVHSQEATLEQIFIRLTGKALV
jgi:fluoroquinolone transport system ATP-binding protein